MMTQTSLNLVTRELVPEDQRLSITERYFGIHFPLKLEPVIYGITDRMAKDYSGGQWDFFTLSNGGFYMAPSGDDVYHVTCDNMFEGDLSADALGITHLSLCVLTSVVLRWAIRPSVRMSLLEFTRAHVRASGGQWDSGGHRLRFQECCPPSLPRAKPMISMGVPAGVGGGSKSRKLSVTGDDDEPGDDGHISIVSQCYQNHHT
jgi:hypothetical protein